MKTTILDSPAGRAFSLIEMLATLVALAVLVSGALAAIQALWSGTNRTKLESQVAQLNAAASIYEANGGSLAGVRNIDDALARLKTVASADKRSRIAGYRGSVVEAGLTAVVQTRAEAAGPAPRAVWSPEKGRFAVVRSGLGVKCFEVDPELATADPVEEDRVASLLLASSDGWIWNYRDFSNPSVSPADVELLAEPGLPKLDSPHPEMLRLNPPRFSVPGGTYDYARFPLTVFLIDENPTASSRVVYTLGDGVWHEDDGRPVAVGPNSRLTAYALANDPEHWMDSSHDSATYQSSFTISGESTGTFRNATGGPGLVTGGGGSLFTWGSPAGTPDPSWLLYNGASFVDVRPDERFLVGEVSYYNGTIWSGTGADSVELAISLAFGGTTEVRDFRYTLDLINTINRASNTADQNADSVRFGDIRSEAPMSLGGVDYTLVLEFGETSANGFATIDQFFVHEDRMATGRLYGTLIPVPVSENDATDGGGQLDALVHATENAAGTLAQALAGGL